MITEDYVSFKMAKLLKEKGFDEPCTYLWVFEKTNNPEVDDNGTYMCPLKRYTESDYWNNASIELYKKEDEYWNDNIDFFACPTIQMVMKWLREAHNIDIIINVSSKNERKYTYVIVSKWFSGTDNVKRTYEEACEAGIKYCLENLI